MLATVAGCWGNRSDAPPVHLQQNMDQQERGDAQELNAFFKDHRVMRTPPSGTVAFGHLKADDHLYRGLDESGAVAGGLPAAIELDDALLRRGEERYGIYCAPCHGLSGRGDGAVTRRGGGLAVEAPSFHRAALQPAPLGYFFRVMTIGKGKMQSYASQVPEHDRWAIAAWVRALQISHQAKQSDVPADALSKTARRAP